MALPQASEGPTGIEKKVCEDIHSRQRVGLRKYGVSVEHQRLTEIEWLQHAYEEALDLSIYLRKIIEEKNMKNK